MKTLYKLGNWDLKSHKTNTAPLTIIIYSLNLKYIVI